MPCVGQTIGVAPREIPPEEVETEVLLAQGDELLRSSRHLLEELDDVIDLDASPEDSSTPR